MKKIIYISIVILFIGCSPNKSELFQVTDSFVESLQTTYDSYGMLGGTEFIKTTTDSEYQVMPIGRLINVKILKIVKEDYCPGLKTVVK